LKATSHEVQAVVLTRNTSCPPQKERATSSARDIQKLRRYTLLAQATSLLVFLVGVISIILFFNPALIGTPQRQQDYYRNQWVWLFIGVCFVIFAILAIIFAARRSRRAIWILNNVEPEPMTLTIETENWSDSTDHYAVLSVDKANDKCEWRVSLYSPSWKVESLAGKKVSAKVYLDPKTKNPSVIETEFGLLWAGAVSSKH
jgi:hypothetical protein